MRIALDYDDTYTLDSNFWDEMKGEAEARGHKMFIVTKRGTEHRRGPVSVPGWEVHNTNSESKQGYCRRNGIDVDVWIDDAPVNILLDGKISIL